MRIGILGTGVVGRTIAGKLAMLDHEVMVGTRNVSQTLSRNEPVQYGLPAFKIWLREFPDVKVGSFAESAKYGEVVINATYGMGSIDALNMAGTSNLNGKILIDIANPLDFSQGTPPILSVSNSESLGEQIQHAFPEVSVVKTLNTVTASLMVNPDLLANGEHSIFLSGDDPGAKVKVAEWLSEWFGWKHIIDLGDITSARGAEMYLPLWLRLWGALGTGILNVRIVI